mmetsp:Transcript_9299/g.18323  ORF Transcript_9299/g.18323 Transcript_9299/m.18323 type:complete len:270 (-) Transcript_9299:1574-2383(-)
MSQSNGREKTNKACLSTKVKKCMDLDTRNKASFLLKVSNVRLKRHGITPLVDHWLFKSICGLGTTFTSTGLLANTHKSISGARMLIVTASRLRGRIKGVVKVLIIIVIVIEPGHVLLPAALINCTAFTLAATATAHGKDENNSNDNQSKKSEQTHQRSVFARVVRCGCRARVRVCCPVRGVISRRGSRRSSGRLSSGNSGGQSSGRGRGSRGRGGRGRGCGLHSRRHGRVHGGGNSRCVGEKVQGLCSCGEHEELSLVVGAFTRSKLDI